MEKQEALDNLAELQAAREAGLVEEWECRNRAAAILDRAGLKPLNLTEYLAERGFTGHGLAQATGLFGMAVKARYRREHGADPLMRHTVVNGQMVAVCAYVEDDRHQLRWNGFYTLLRRCMQSGAQRARWSRSRRLQ